MKKKALQKLKSWIIRLFLVLVQFNIFKSNNVIFNDSKARLVVL